MTPAPRYIRDAVRNRQSRDLEANRERLQREREAAEARILRRRKYAEPDGDASAVEVWL